jgi:hypothetical protein
MYKRLCVSATPPYAKLMWEAKLPIKIKKITWQLAIGRLPSNDQMVKRHGPSNCLCALSNQTGDVDHVFFSCLLAMFMWSGFREMLGVQWNPESFSQFLPIMLSLNAKCHRLVWTLFAAQNWALHQGLTG